MTKKTVKKAASAPKPIVKAAPVAAAPVSTTCECNCNGHRRGFWHFAKKLLVYIIVFLLGVAACKLCCYKHHGFGKHMRFSFENGCLDVSKIKCPMLAQKVMAADANGDGCITKAELRAWKKSKFQKSEFKKSDEGCPSEMEEAPETEESLVPVEE